MEIQNVTWRFFALTLFLATSGWGQTATHSRELDRCAGGLIGEFAPYATERIVLEQLRSIIDGTRHIPGAVFRISDFDPSTFTPDTARYVAFGSLRSVEAYNDPYGYNQYRSFEGEQVLSYLESALFNGASATDAMKKSITGPLRELQDEGMLAAVHLRARSAGYVSEGTHRYYFYVIWREIETEELRMKQFTIEHTAPSITIRPAEATEDRS